MGGKPIRGLMLLLFLTSTLAIVPIRAETDVSSKTISVPDDYATIQEAINNAVPGDTVFVRAGNYSEQLVVNKTISLIGEDSRSTMIESQKDQDIITVTSDGNVISGFDLRMKVNSLAHYAVRLCNSSGNTISNNTISKSFVGVMVEGGLLNTIERNFLFRNRYGIFTRRFQNNFASSFNIIFHNLIVESTWNGIEIDWGEGNTVYANTIVNSTGYALEIPWYTPSYHNLIFRNNFVDNGKDWSVIYQAYGPVPNSWANNGEGNYWSDYKGKDEDHDGIGDVPVFTQENTVDNYPLMGSFSDFAVSNDHVTTVSNCAITAFDFGNYGVYSSLFLDLSKETGNLGFVRISIPKALITDPYEVQINGSSIEYPQVRTLPCSNETLECFYINLSSGRHTLSIEGITGIPEFPFLPLQAFALVFASVSVILKRRKRNISRSATESLSH